MNIYFSGSIKGGRQLVDRYRQIIEYLKTYGAVLTEHIGDSTYASQGYRDAQVVYSEDRALMDISDVVVAEVTIPSLGVGYELAYCEVRKIPVLCLYNCNAQSVSSMIVGNTYFHCVQYGSVNEAKIAIDKFFSD